MGSDDTLPIVWKNSSTHEEYEQARIGRIFNHRRPDRSPAAVLEAENDEQISQAVQVAKQKNLRVSVRSGGHSWAAWSVRDNAILIDLGNYQYIDLNEDTRIVSVSPSTTGNALNSFLRGRGLMFPGGHCPDVGLGGFLLQGGMGWVCRSWGWACQYVRAIDVITADGQNLRCDEKLNSDLFWAARGAGPGFPAVVIKFHLQTRALPTHMFVSFYIFPKTHFKSALNWAISLVKDYDEDTEIVCVGQSIPDYQDSILLVSFTTFKNSEEDAKRALSFAEESVPEGYLQKTFASQTSLQQEYVQQSEANPKNHRYCADNAYIHNEKDVSSVLEEAFTTLPNRKSFALWYAMAPTSRNPLPDMALSMHSDHYLAIYTIWESPIDDNYYQSWTHGVMEKIEAHSVGQYLGDADFQVRNTKYWGEQQGRKLMQIRKKWDPDGRICGYLDQGDESGAKGILNQFR